MSSRTVVNQRGVMHLALLIVGVLVVSVAAFATYRFLQPSKPKLETTKNETPFMTEPVAPRPVPNLYVVTRDDVRYARYDAAAKKYLDPQLFADVGKVVKMNTTKQAVFLYTPETVERWSHDGKREAVWRRDSSPTYAAPTAEAVRMGSATADELQTALYDNGKIYVAANKSLIILDETLHELGHVTPLGRSEFYAYKAIDDLLVKDQYVFLVDDIASPLFVFSVDASNPTDPKLLRTIGVGGVYGTISNQWFNYQTDEWCFQQSTSSGYTGDRHTVICVAPSLYQSAGQTNPDGYLASEAEGLRLLEVGSGMYETPDEPERGEGFTIVRELNRTDDWMLIEDRKSQDDFIAGLGNDYAIEAKLSMGQYLQRTDVWFYRYAGYVYLYALDQLNLFEDDGTNLTALAGQTIPQVDVPNTGGYQGTHKAAAWTYFAADPRVPNEQ